MKNILLIIYILIIQGCASLGPAPTTDMFIQRVNDGTIGHKKEQILVNASIEKVESLLTKKMDACYSVKVTTTSSTISAVDIIHFINESKAPNNTRLYVLREMKGMVIGENKGVILVLDLHKNSASQTKVISYYVWGTEKDSQSALLWAQGKSAKCSYFPDDTKF
jgi:hypothetical protein